MNEESKTISNWIDNLIEDLVNPQIKISDTLIKTQVLAFKIKNIKFQEWVNDELNGYIDKSRPPYRWISAQVMGNLICDAGFRGIIQKNNYPIPIDYLDEKTKDNLTVVSMDAKVSILEEMSVETGTLRVYLPHPFSLLIDEQIKPWHVDSAWQTINQSSLIGVLTTIKSTLLKFLLELNNEFGNNNDLSIMKKKTQVDKLFEKTIGNISGHHVNITVGTGNNQGIIVGDNATQNNAAGQNIEQSMESNIYEETKQFIELLEAELLNFPLEKDDLEDIKMEISRINTQLVRAHPKKSILSGALNSINSILLGVAGNAATPIVLDTLQKVIGYFN